MDKRASQATTRTQRFARTVGAPLLLSPGQIVRSAESGTRYGVRRLLGFGGYGQVYLSERLGSSREIPDLLCIKVSPYLDSWVREAYFGQLLEGHPRAIRVFDRFMMTQPDERPLYYLALEYARHGDLSSFLQSTGRAWAERTARREIAGILEVLGKLHRGQLLHRD